MKDLKDKSSMPCSRCGPTGGLLEPEMQKWHFQGHYGELSVLPKLLEEGEVFCHAKNIPLKMGNSVNSRRKAIAIEAAEQQNVASLLNTKRVVSHLDCPLPGELRTNSWCGPHGHHQHRMEGENKLKAKFSWWLAGWRPRTKLRSIPFSAL